MSIPMGVTASDAAFCFQSDEHSCKKVNHVKKRHHQPTHGESISNNLSKAGNYVLLTFEDLWNRPADSSKKRELFTEDLSASNFLKTGQLLSNKEVQDFITYLQKKYDSTSIKVFYDSLQSCFKYIRELDPLYLITGKTISTGVEKSWTDIRKDVEFVPENPDIDENEEPADWSVVLNDSGQLNLKEEDENLMGPKIDEDWMMVKIGDIKVNRLRLSKKEKKIRSKINRNLILKKINEINERYMAYPFVYPSGSIMRYPHIVLIIIDRTEKKIYYYDPKGLTSDDPTYLNLFIDDSEFNMHKNLVMLAKFLFKGTEDDIIYNLDVHQTDPFNCGAFVCMALEKLHQGMSVPDALNFNSYEQSITEIRKRMGLELMDSKQKKNSKLVINQSEQADGVHGHLG